MNDSKKELFMEKARGYYSKDGTSSFLDFINRSTDEEIIEFIAYCKEDNDWGTIHSQRLRDVLMSYANLRNAKIIKSSVDKFSCTSTCLTVGPMALAVITIIIMIYVN